MRNLAKKLLDYFRFKPQIITRHETHAILKGLPKCDFKYSVRMGSLEIAPHVDVEINTANAIRNSADKERMKECFKEGNVRTAKWFKSDRIEEVGISGLPYPIVIKHVKGSRGTGNYLINNTDELLDWLNKRKRVLKNYIFEEFLDYQKEYRLHVWEGGCFYSCRKMRRENTKSENMWQFKFSDCYWVKDTNPDFKKPKIWDEIEKECVKALNSVGLSVGACDVKVQGDDFFVIEINSAPSFGKVTGQKYMEILPKIAKTIYSKT